MSNSKKLLIAALAVIFLAGATPLTAQLAGTWAGEGEGWCPFPVPYPSEYMKPWQNWKGFIPNSEDVFTGEWWDGDNKRGNFKGEIIFISPEDAYCKGEWTWLDERFYPPREYYMGPFSMKFKLVEKLYCYGEWQGHLPSGIYSGTMEGKKVD